MRILMFYHSVISDWNHGNAHFLRGIATELHARGHDVIIYEPHDSWSLHNLLQEQGPLALRRFNNAYPHLRAIRYSLRNLYLPAVLEGADLVLVHEWNPPELVASIGEYRRTHDHFLLYFHDTHHRSVSAPHSMSAYDLRYYDAAFVYGASIRDVYLSNDWCENVFVWHEAADTRVFRPRRETTSSSHNQNPSEGDIVWIGNWGDDERASEIREFFVNPVRELGLRATVYGVRYPAHAIAELESAGIHYAGWAPNFEVPQIFSRFKVTVHVPRRPYTKTLTGIPTIRPFEAMACGIPLISAPWHDSEGLFTADDDYAIAHDSSEMEKNLRFLLRHESERARMATHARNTILRRHTCSHRVNELLAVHSSLSDARAGAAA